MSDAELEAMARTRRGVRRRHEWKRKQKDFLHLTWRGRAEMIRYQVRRLFIADAPDAERCCMGYPIGDHGRCPRRVSGDSLWCARHRSERS